MLLLFIKMVNEISQVTESAVGEGGDVSSVFIDQTVRQQEYLGDTGLQCSGVFNDIIAYHNAFLRLQIQLCEDLPVISGVRLVEGAVS